MDTLNVPTVLLEFLIKHFPDKAPRSDAGGLFALGKAAGVQEVIDVLRKHHDQQQETSDDVYAESQNASPRNTRRRSRRSESISIRI